MNSQLPNNPEAFKALLEIQQQQESIKNRESFWKAYLWSVLLPPLGVYYFIKYFFFKSETEGTKKAAILSLVLTIVSLVLNIWLIGLFFNQSVSTGNNQNLNMLKDIITPENQKKLQQLLR